MEMDWLVCTECIEMEINGYVWSFDEDMEMEVNRFVWCLLEGNRLDLLY